MPYPEFTKIIINHFIKQHKSLINPNYQHHHTYKDDGIESRLKFVRIGKKTAGDCQETIDVSKESEPEPEQTKKKTSSKRRFKKKVTLTADANIISDDRDAALELAKIVTESVPETVKKKSGGRSSKSVVIQDTLIDPKSKPATSKTKLKGTEGSNEGTGSKPGVLISPQSSLLPQVKELDDKDGDVDDEGDDHISDTQDADDEDIKNKSDEDDIYKYKIRVHKDKDEKIINGEVDEEITDAANADAEKTSEVKDDPKKTKLPPSSSSLSVSFTFCALYQSMHANKSFNRNPANHRLYHALIEAMIEDENAMDKGVADTVKNHKRKHDDDENPPVGQNQCKKTKKRRTKVSESSKKPSSTKETPKAHDNNQQQDASKPKTTKTLNLDWFKQPPSPPTPNPEWNKRVYT
nr:hypothetical protein [Tanacetum cinerariifolium]